MNEDERRFQSNMVNVNAIYLYHASDTMSCSGMTGVSLCRANLLPGNKKRRHEGLRPVLHAYKLLLCYCSNRI